MALLRSLFSSKKFLAMLSGVIGLVALKVFKVAVDPATVAEIVGLIAIYIGGQSIADHGKEKAKIEAVSAASQTSTAARQAVTAMAESMTPPKGEVS